MVLWKEYKDRYLPPELFHVTGESKLGILGLRLDPRPAPENRRIRSVLSTLACLLVTLQYDGGWDLVLTACKIQDLCSRKAMPRDLCPLKLYHVIRKKERAKCRWQIRTGAINAQAQMTKLNILHHKHYDSEGKTIWQNISPTPYGCWTQTPLLSQETLCAIKCKAIYSRILPPIAHITPVKWIETNRRE